MGLPSLLNNTNMRTEKKKPILNKFSFPFKLFHLFENFGLVSSDYKYDDSSIILNKIKPVFNFSWTVNFFYFADLPMARICITYSEMTPIPCFTWCSGCQNWVKSYERLRPHVCGNDQLLISISNKSTTLATPKVRRSTMSIFYPECMQFSFIITPHLRTSSLSNVFCIMNSLRIRMLNKKGAGIS